VVVVREVANQDAAQVALAQNEDMVETLAPDRMSRSPKGFCQGRARCNDDLANAQVLDAALEISAVDGIAIAEQVGGAGLVRERVDDLLSRPGGGGLVGDAEVEEFSAVVAEYHEGEEQAKGQGRYDEEVDGRDVVTVSSQEGAPGRRRVTGGAAQVLGDGEGSDIIAEEAEFGLNPAPAQVGFFSGHASNQAAYLELDRRTTRVSGVGTSNASRVESPGGANRPQWRAGQ
jgi:hypothetical protein